MTTSHSSANFSGIVGDTSSKVSDLQKQVDILHYNFKIQLDTKNKLIQCSSEITATPLSSTLKEIELDLYDNLDVSEARIVGSQSNYFRKNNKIFIKSDQFLSDTFNVFVKYKGRPKRAGFDGFVFGEVNNSKIVYTISEPTFAPTWFVCDDDPSDKAFLDIEIINDSQFVSVSNGILKSVNNFENEKSYHYKTIYPISTYLIAIYSAPYKNFEDTYYGISGRDSMQIKYFAFPEHFENAKTDFAEHKEMLKVFSKIFGEYPFIKEKYGVAEFLWNFGAMENQTITGIGYTFVSGRNFFTDIYVHELAHQWWGNAVTLKTWDDIWLNEGFASYSEALYAEAKSGKEALISKMNSKFSEHFSGKLYAPNNLFGQTVYDKGAWVLHMLRFEIGDSSFFKSLRTYYDTFKYSNASVSDFKNICETVSGESLDKFFDQWIYNGDEIIKCNYSYLIRTENNKTYCDFKVDQIQESYPEFNFPIELLLKFDDGSSELKKIRIDSRNQMLTFEIKKPFKEIIIDPDNKLLALFNKVSFN
jgi:aminopeptidase N